MSEPGVDVVAGLLDAEGRDVNHHRFLFGFRIRSGWSEAIFSLRLTHEQKLDVAVAPTPGQLVDEAASLLAEVIRIVDGYQGDLLRPRETLEIGIDSRQPSIQLVILAPRRQLQAGAMAATMAVGSRRGSAAIMQVRHCIAASAISRFSNIVFPEPTGATITKGFSPY